MGPVIEDYGKQSKNIFVKLFKSLAPGRAAGGHFCVLSYRKKMTKKSPDNSSGLLSGQITGVKSVSEFVYFGVAGHGP